MNRLIGRPGRFFLPIALGLYAGLVSERGFELMLAILAARLCSLCAGSALRAAATRVVSSMRLTGNYYVALLMGVAGGLAATALWLAPMSPLHGYIPADVAIAGALIMLAQLAADGLYTLPDSASGNACDIIIALFACAGLLISGDGGMALPAAAGICALAAVALSLALRPRLRCRSGYKTLLSVPGALVRMGIPCAIMAFMLADREDAINGFWLCLFWAIFDAMEAPVRRSKRESCWLYVGCAMIISLASSMMADLYTGAFSYVAVPVAGLLTTGALLLFCGPIGLRSAILTLIMAVIAALILGYATGWLSFSPSRITYIDFAINIALSFCIVGLIIDKKQHIQAKRMAKRRRRT